ncbi:MAG: glycosyl hydrolase family 18 protein [bacterium]
MRIIFTVIILFFSFHVASLAQHELVGYFHNWNSQDVAWVHPQNIDARYTVIAVAFAMPVSNTDMTMTFTPENMSVQAFKQAIAQLKAQGKKVLISIGGATAYLDFPNDNAKQAFITSMNDIMDTYDFDGIDIDIEHGNCIIITGGTIANPSNASQVRLIDAIKTIMNHHQSSKGKKMILTMAPETAYVQGGQSGFGSIWGGYLPIIHALRDSLDILQVQLYNSGTMYGIDRNIYTQGTADFIVAMTEAVIQGFATAGGQFNGLPASKVAVGLPSCTSAAGGGYVDTATIMKAMKYLRGKGSKPGSYAMVSGSGYPNLKGMMTWSINWDAKAQCNGAYSFAECYQNVHTEPPQVPGLVTMIAPAYGQTLTEELVKFTWNKIPNVTYHVEILQGGTIIKSDSTLQDTIVNVGGFEYSQLHTWRVRAKNAQGWGQWNSPWTFTSMKLPLPSQTIPLSPQEYAIVKKDSMIQFRWNAAKNRILSYTFTLQKGNDIIHRKLDIKDTVYAFALPEYGTTYTWKVQAVNVSGWGLASNARVISTSPKPLELPSVISFIEPYVDVLTSDSITFKWSSSGPMIQRHHLRIQLDDEVLIDDTSLIDTVLTLTMPRRSGVLSWMGRSYNSSGYGPWSAKDSAIYRHLPPIPEMTMITIPKDSMIINTDTASISWKIVDYADADEVQVLHADAQAKRDTIVKSNEYIMRNLSNNQRYDIRVRGLNERGKSEWSRYVTFFTSFGAQSIVTHTIDHIIANNAGIIITLSETPKLPLSLHLSTLQGRYILKSTVHQQVTFISTQQLTTGVYFLTINQHSTPIIIQ